MARSISARLTTAEGRKFGLVVGGAFLLLGALLWWRAHTEAALIAAVLGAGLILGGLALPAHMGPLYRAWMALALAISKVTTPLFMGIIYFLVLTPTGLIARSLGHRPLVRSRRTGSYWVSRAEGSRRGEMDHQF
jgi:Saxitoxin biosynthesis operon protein SxtJ